MTAISEKDLLLKVLSDPAMTVSVAGCSKNAGKTTVMNVLTRNWQETRLGILSIGIDGEDADFWLGIPKPRVAVVPGTIIATAERALDASTADMKIVQRTGIGTPLGELVIAEAVTPGMVLLAGIRHKADVADICSRMKYIGAGKIVIDGAYQRLMSADPDISDGLILATGAILGKTVAEVTEKSLEFIDRIRLPQIDDPIFQSLFQLTVTTGMAVMCGRDGAMTTADGPGPEAALALVAKPGYQTVAMAVPGVIPPGFCDRLAGGPGCGALLKDGCTFTLLIQDATRIFIKGDEFNRFVRKGHRIQVAKRIHLIAIAINPVSVLGYTLPSEELVAAIEKMVPGIPVVDFVAASAHNSGASV